MKTPRVLFFDIETKPVKAWIWRTGKQYVNHKNIVNGERFDIICIAYRWAHESRTKVLLWDKNQSSAQMVDAFTKIVESADVVIGQNSDAFDVKQVNTQRMLHNQRPIAWPTTEDLRKQVKKHFYVTSSSLEYMSKLLTEGGKDRMEFDDWLDIVEKKCPKALKKMARYCRRDVDKLVEVWNRVQPYITIKANRALIAGIRDACPKCASTATKKDGIRVLVSGKKQKHRCLSCGGNFETTYTGVL